MGWFTLRPDHAKVASKIAEIESEMKRIGIWQEQPLPHEQIEIKTAFGQGQMSFEQWLQFVFITNVKQIIVTKGKFPTESHVSEQAFREWVAWGSEENAKQLLDLLYQFDALFGWALWGLFQKLDEFIDHKLGKR